MTDPKSAADLAIEGLAKAGLGAVKSGGSVVSIMEGLGAMVDELADDTNTIESLTSDETESDIDDE